MCRPSLVVLVAALARTSLAAAQDEPADRWQLTLRDSKIVYEVRPDRLEGDDLVLRRASGTLRIPLREITELRWVRGTYAPATAGMREARGSLVGAGDLIFEMTLLDIAEKREIVSRILQVMAGGGSG